VVSFLIGATNGIAYKSLIGRLQSYPIPEIPVADGKGLTLLDIGCSWGRWCIAAAAKGYLVIGIDPSLGAIMAARRVAQELGVKPHYVVGDARYLPLATESVDSVFSYSVLQHFSKQNAAQAVSEIGRVLSPSGSATVQFPTKLGIRCVYQQARRCFREPKDFEVRYWSHRELSTLFKKHIGETNFKIDCFFGIGLQYSDRELYSLLAKNAVKVSEILKNYSDAIPPLKFIADSIFLHSIKQHVAAC
jgi:ubiquinone/menaquinone biosynthesis C-methylase UbiE